MSPFSSSLNTREIVVDRLADNRLSPCQRHSYTLIIPLPLFAFRNDTFKAMLRDQFHGKTLNNACSDDRHKTRVSTSQS